MDRFRQTTEQFQRRKEFLVGSLIGLSVMLLALLAVVVAPNPRAAQAQSDPRVVLSVDHISLTQGDRSQVTASFFNMPRETDSTFGNISYRYYLERASDGSWTEADNCLEDFRDEERYIGSDKSWASPLHLGPTSYSITQDCPVGSYRLLVRVFDRDTNPNTELASDTRALNVSLGPSVTVEMPAGPYYRGAAINATIKFNDLAQGADYTYEAYLMARNPNNFADICEGTGLERNKTFKLDSVSGNPVQKAVTITDDCPTNEYTLHVKIYDSDDRLRGSIKEEFEVTTDPDAEPSVQVRMTESSPVTPGTVFNIYFSFNDILPGSSVKYLTTMTDTSTNQALAGKACGGGILDWGREFQAVVNKNPHVIGITIPSDCPAGNYRIVADMNERSDQNIISGSIDFVIGYPDLTPTAPSISGYTAKQNAPFIQQLPVGSGGDGTLTYTATGLPSGLSFITTTRTITGTPTGTGTSTVRYTVSDSDGDSDSIDFTITVNPDLTPTAPSIPGYTARQNLPFTQQLPAGSGGDGNLTYSVTGLPDGLTFVAETRTITGTPTTVQAPVVTYTVRDSDNDESSTTFTITVAADQEPTLSTISGYTARVGSPFSEVLPAASGGDAPLEYSVTGLPAGLNFIETTRTITGTPTTEEAPTVTYTVEDSDGDESSTTFTITVTADLNPTLSTISGYTARVGSSFSEVLPAATGGDTPLEYSVTGLPAGLSFIETTRTITGTPTTEEAPTVTYTVEDSDGDDSSTTFTITVAADQEPTLSTISGYTARVGSPFSEVLPAASGGDAPLEYSVTGLPAGLSFIETTRTITGTPTTEEAPTVTYTVEDSDGDDSGTTFTITVAADLNPILSTISGYTARVGSSFSEVLPAATGGDTPLVYSATGLPDGLTFTEATRTIAGTPTTVESPAVTYTVRDDDGDEAVQTFTIAVAADLKPTLGTISNANAKLTKQFTLQLPAAGGGDGHLDLPSNRAASGSFLCRIDANDHGYTDNGEQLRCYIHRD